MNFYDRMKLLEQKELLTMLALHPNESLTTIADKYGLSRTTLYYKLFKHGISSDKTYFTKEERAQLLKTYDQELNHADLILRKEYEENISALEGTIEVLNLTVEYERSRKWYHKLFGWY